MGYTKDPVLIKQPVYNSLLWEDIFSFYQDNLASKPVVIAIVGDKKKIDFDALKKYGRIVEIKEKSLFSK
jgi:hypothetical protein